ncbi:hypothetical protein ONZ43_g2152 [Nemania bipapillata]|uniref:Uncharacterized protein n=1 Tax=Nemania bipapillata TaxID=110536 RepID=A0ACC2J2F9_9PEZI|nr:hypothetical protein ONZ43_g2152 [Nemania bipapillata]
MYLPERNIIVPPEAGWPSIINADQSILNGLGKTPEVIALLTRLHYIKQDGDSNNRSHGAPECFFADWQSLVQGLTEGKTNAGELKIITENTDMDEEDSSPTIGLTIGADNPLFVLDTSLGIIHWSDCPGQIKDNPVIEPVDLEDDSSEDRYREDDWRSDAPAWAIPDFFELLKEQFRQLVFIPISPYTVTSVFVQRSQELEGMVPMLQEIYREHGWPDIEQYRKRECLEAVQRALEERYPDEADFRRSG